MTNSMTENWIPCSEPQEGDTLRWVEPIWAAPNKPRGKPDKIGEQMVTAIVVSIADVIELEVQDAQNMSRDGDTAMKVKSGDRIRRKITSIAKSDCHKLQE